MHFAIIAFENKPFQCIGHNGGINYDFPFNNIRRVPREVLKPIANLEVFNTSLGTLQKNEDNFADTISYHMFSLVNAFMSDSDIGQEFII